MKKKPANLGTKSKEWLIARGYSVEKTEHFDLYAHRRKDLLGVADYLALNGKELLLVQVTDYTSADDHKKKIKDSELLKLWISGGGTFCMHLWKKHERSNRWHVSEHTYQEIMDGTRKKYGLPE